MADKEKSIDVECLNLDCFAVNSVDNLESFTVICWQCGAEITEEAYGEV